MPASYKPNPLPELPGYLLRRAAQVMMAELHELLAALEMRISDASILLLIANRTDMTSSEIGKLLDIQRANMVPLLNRLEVAGLIERRPIDRKSQAILLSDAGKKMKRRLEPLIHDFEQSLLMRIPEQHRDHFVPALNALIG